MGRRSPTLLCALVLVAAGALTACSSDGTDNETEPTYADVEQVAKDLYPGEGCRFEVDDNGSEDLEDKSLSCETKVDGQLRLFGVMQYTRDEDVSEADRAFGGLTTVDRYFQNGNITAEAIAASSPGQPELDAEEFAEAIKDKCGCGEVVSAEQ